MTTIIAPSGEAVGTTFCKPEEYAADARRRGWLAAVHGERVYLQPGKVLAAHIRAAEESVK